jgi:hypothetical protein
MKTEYNNLYTHFIFSTSKSDVDRVCKYILNQPEHHRKVSFTEEYEEFIKFYQKALQPFKKHH